MKALHTLSLFACSAVLALAPSSTLSGQAQAPAQGQGRGQPAPPPPPQAGHPSGKLVIWGDVALFNKPDDPDNCILTNRFKRGQRVGFRMTAIDGGTGEVENTAILVAHVNYGGKTVDAPMRWRGAAGLQPDLAPGRIDRRPLRHREGTAAGDDTGGRGGQDVAKGARLKPRRRGFS